MIRVPHSTSFPMTESSLLTIDYRLFSSVSHCSFRMHSLTLDSSLSTAETRSITRVDRAHGVAFSATNLTYSSGFGAQFRA